MNEASKNQTEKLTRYDVELSRTGSYNEPPMRLTFFDPPRDEVAAVANDLIIRFGLIRVMKPCFWPDFLSKCVLAGIGGSTGWRLAR